MTTPDDSGTAFAAGVATATAEQAAETAATAENHAVEAAELADIAIDSAIGAQETAWNAQDAVSQLRGELLSRMDELEGKLGNVAQGDDGTAAPAPERKEKAEPAKANDDDGNPEPAKESKSYGSAGWFGKR